MDVFDRISALRQHHRHECDCDWPLVEEHLDQIQAELAELLARLPAPDLVPAHITLTAS